MSARPLAALAATALVSTALVGAAPAAQAKKASVKTTYTCEASVLGAQDVGVTIKLNLPGKVKKGKPVAQRPVNMTVTLPEGLVSPLRDLLGVEELSGNASKIKYSVGSQKIPLKKVKLAQTPVPDSGSMTLKAKGIAGGFKAPKKPGTYVIKAPTNFTFTARDGDGAVIGGSVFPCSIADGAPVKLGSLNVVK